MIVVQIVNGLMEGAMLFLIASGLTLIFGVSRIVNFAHGSLYMLGAFIAHSLIQQFPPAASLPLFFAEILAAALLVALIGGLIEIVILRRIYAADELHQLIITIGVVLIVRDLVRLIWGVNDLSTPMPEALSGALRAFGMFFPAYQVTVMAIGIGVFLGLVALLRFTRFGILTRAATDDRGMVALLGINQKQIFTGVVTLGSFLAGLAGALFTPYGNINHLLDTTIIVGAFIVVVIGGMGNLYGTVAAAVAVGVIKALGLLYVPRLSMVLIFLIMAAVLVARSMGRKAANE